MPNHRLPPLAALALTSCLFATAAQAHSVLERKEAAPNSGYRGVVQVMHGCDGATTNRVTVTIPEGVIGAKPVPKPGWTVTTTRGPYSKSYQSFHGMVSEGVKTITWSGGSLPDDQVDEFTFFARISDAFAPGATVHFPIDQECDTGTLRWVEIPAEGQDAQALKLPAPAVRIVAVGPKPAPISAPAALKAGDLSIGTPWARATPGGAKVGAGYLTLTNHGQAADKLVSAKIPQAGRTEIHSMSLGGGVMKMALVEGGLAIEPGKSVELKPGGYHLMFLDLTAPLIKGDSIKGTLTFERAGTVPVEFRIEAIGSQGASGHQNHH